jgi:Na+/proline symporter
MQARIVAAGLMFFGVLSFRLYSYQSLPLEFVLYYISIGTIAGLVGGWTWKYQKIRAIPCGAMAGEIVYRLTRLPTEVTHKYPPLNDSLVVLTLEGTTLCILSLLLTFTGSLAVTKFFDQCGNRNSF